MSNREGKIMFTHPQTIWHPKMKIFFFCCFVRLMQVGIKSSIICLVQFSQAVQTPSATLQLQPGRSCVCPKNPCVYVSGLEVLGSQVKHRGMRSALPPSGSFIMVNQVQAFTLNTSWRLNHNLLLWYVNIFRFEHFL